MESTIRGGTPPPSRASGKDVDSLGPSDRSDTGSDIQGERPMATGPDNESELGATVADLSSDSDASGTGERASADGRDPLDGEDIMPDRIIDDPNPNASDDPTRRQKSFEAAELPIDDDTSDIDDEDDDEDGQDGQEDEQIDQATGR
jgi:hypothetical protein